MLPSKPLVVSALATALLAVSVPAAVAGAADEDARLADRIEARFASDRGLFPRALHVSVENGVAHVSGNVNSESEREQALELARRVEGVRAVDDGIVVAAGPSKAVSASVGDAATTARVKSRLAWDADTDAVDLSVNTTDGVVTLSGKVESQAEADRAREIALATEGVREVRTEFEFGKSRVDEAEDKVKATARAVESDVQDAWISGKVTKAIELDHRFSGAEIDVRTEDGVVTLVGEVREPRQREQLIAAVQGVAGVREVRSDIAIR